ncbi:MAG: hypothetical protein GY894_03810 [Planctomycetes bacterium]|jgi:hypothetical protein|nr:hypothetical protein [Planctomycetota bacterium]MCP4838475.1 hypothetical protein [Planctomycetota bacterium]
MTTPTLREQPPATASAQGVAGLIGLILVRCIVPIWITAGAATKLVERSPKLLPEHLRGLLESVGFDLHVALAFFIAIEFAAIAVMVLLPRLARGTAVLMLLTFCLVLLYEMFNGNVTSCGCLGSVSPPPWLMLSIDLTLLILVVALPVRSIPLMNDRASWALVTLLSAVLGIVAFTRVLGGATGVTVVVDTPTQDGETSATSNENNGSPAVTLPAYYSINTSDWPGQHMSDIDLLSWIPNLPDSITSGKQYLILYSRTCEHCNELLLEYFSFDPPAPTTLVAIPENKDGFIEEGTLENPCLDCGEVELPIGVDWLITPPVVISLEDGVIRCAQEAEDYVDPQCLPWHGF